MYNGFWYCYDDVPAGGDSEVKLDTKSIEKASMKGKVTSKYEYSFIGMGYYLSPSNVRKPFDLGNNRGIRFTCKGGGNVFRVKIVSTHPSFINKDSDNQFGFDFTASASPQKFEIPFASMSQQPGWGSPVNIKDALTRIKEIQFMTTTRPLERAELEIEGLEII
ncbi:MAG: CIA30 family protein [Candidatus Goldiibacteriota bacterium]|jgi:hypothetical protein